MERKGSHLLSQEDSKETSQPHRCSVHCCTVARLVSPVCSWLASWRSPSKIWALGICLEYRFSIWQSSIRCEVFLNWFPGKFGKGSGRNVSAFSLFWEFLQLWLAHVHGTSAFSRGLAMLSQHASSLNNNTSPFNKCSSSVQEASPLI